MSDQQFADYKSGHRRGPPELTQNELLLSSELYESGWTLNEICAFLNKANSSRPSPYGVNQMWRGLTDFFGESLRTKREEKAPLCLCGCGKKLPPGKRGYARKGYVFKYIPGHGPGGINGRPTQDLTGQVFNGWTAIRFIKPDDRKYKQRSWVFLCPAGIHELESEAKYIRKRKAPCMECFPPKRERSEENKEHRKAVYLIESLFRECRKEDLKKFKTLERDFNLKWWYRKIEHARRVEDEQGQRHQDCGGWHSIGAVLVPCEEYEEWRLKSARGGAGDSSFDPRFKNPRKVSETDRDFILERDGCCLRCGSEKDLVIDHVDPVALGGTNHRDNLQTLCQACNSWKRARKMDFRPVSNFAISPQQAF